MNVAPRPETPEVETRTSGPQPRRAATDHMLQTIAENATLGLVMMDVGQKCTYLNAAAERILGWTLDEILAQDRPLHDIVHYLRPDGSPYAMCDCPIDRALPQRAREQGEDVFVHRDGHFYPVAFTASPILENGVPVGTVIEVRDLTEELKQQRALRESEERYRFLAESLPVQVWTATPAGLLDYVSTRTTSYFGMSAEALLADNWQSVVHPDDLPNALGRWTTALSTGAPYESEFRLRAADGTYHWHLARAVPQRGGDGVPVRWFGTNTDIHERRNAEATRDELLALVELERTRLREVFTHAPAVIGVYEGPEFRVTVANEMWNRFTGRTNSIGKRYVELFPENLDAMTLLEQVRTTGVPFVANEMLVPIDRNGDGVAEDLWWTFVLQPMRGATGEVDAVLAHAVEVTEQVVARRHIETKATELARVASELERTNKELDQFAYVASHDLKAPLRGIANLAHFVEDDLGDKVTDTTREHLKLLRGRVQRMDALIDGILKYSRAARTTGPVERLDLGKLVRDCIELLAPPKEIEIKVVTPMPTVEAEKVPFQQVFLNLISNAVKYGRAEGGHVQVGCETASDEWTFFVKDDGAGIAPEFHERIWGIFQTLEARDRVEGTGIGLSVVRKIVESRGGRAWVESTPGQGATFRFTWPR